VKLVVVVARLRRAEPGTFLHQEDLGGDQAVGLMISSSVSEI
jgi:hypothetical protein